MAVDERAKVVRHEEIGGGYRYLSFAAPRIAAGVAPGQFVHLRVPGLEESALRRPFSVFDAEDGVVTVLYKTVGRGTAALNRAAVGEEIMVEGPLGHGFPLECACDAFFVAGGYGVAPLHFLARRIECAGRKILFAGGRTAADLLALDRYAALGVEVRAATNDGSAGTKGLVTDPLDDELAAMRDRGARFELFACGPDPMLRAVALRATGTGSKGWISMDRHMVCGVGACYACIQRTVRGNSRCCIEGPVFAAEDLVW